MADPKHVATPKYEPPKELPYGAQTQKSLGRAKKTPDDQAEYFYNIRRTHIVFFFSSAALLVSLVWMFYDDSFTRRPWKQFQRTYQELEFAKLQDDLRALNREAGEKQGKISEIDRRIEKLQAQLEDPQQKWSTVLGVLEAKESALQAEAAKHGWKLRRIDQDEKEKLARRVRYEVKDIQRAHLQKLKDQVLADHYYKQQTLNFSKSDFMTIRWRFEEAEHHAREAAHTQKAEHAQQVLQAERESWRKINDDVLKAKLAFDDVDWLLAVYDDLLLGTEAELNQLKADRGRLRKEIEDKLTRFKREKPQFANAVRNAPMLDFFDPTIKVDQVLLDNVYDNFHFAKISKVDRCHTCHKGINNPDYEVTIDRSAPEEVDRYTFKNRFLRSMVEHARKKVTPDKCEICRMAADTKAEFILQVPHGSWSDDDAIKYTKALMAHPRRELFVDGNSKHPIDRIGCTVCHEGDGRETDFSRAVHMPSSKAQQNDWVRRYDYHYRHLWDAPMLPSKHVYASCRRCHNQETELMAGGDYTKGMLLYERLGCYACHRTDSYQILPKDLKDPNLDPNRRFRRPGPPLTHVKDKAPAEWIYKWLLNPKEFRLTTRMPRFFGQSNARSIQLSKDLARDLASAGQPQKVPADAKSFAPQQIESVTAAAITEYLLAVSDSRAYGAPPSLKGDAARGARIFEQIGCRACHTATPDDQYRVQTGGNRDNALRAADGESWYLKEFGPNLNAMGTKLGAGTPFEASGRRWLYHWIKSPDHYFGQTRMPKMRPQDKDEMGDQELMDLVEYLMSLQKPAWAQDARLPDLNQKDNDLLLDYLVFEQLRLKMPDVDALAELGSMKASSETKRLWYGRKMVQNFGCFSCHEMRPENEADVARLNSRIENRIDWLDLEGIGVELTGAQPEGVKAVDKLDFGYAGTDELGNHRGVSFKHGFTGEQYEQVDQSTFPVQERKPEVVRVPHLRHEWFFNKLLDPRVYDGGKLGSKPADELLKMPNFYLNAEEARLVTTFIMSFTPHDIPDGTVAAVKKRLSADEAAFNRGQRLVRENNCTACHRFQLDRFLVNYRRRVKDEKTGLVKDVTTDEWIEGRYGEVFSREETAASLAAWGLLPSGTTAEHLKNQWVRKIAWTSNHRTLEPVEFVNQQTTFVAFDGADLWFIDGTTTQLNVARRIKAHIPMEGGDIIAQIEGFKTKHAEALGLQKQGDHLAHAELENRIPPMLRTQGSKTQPEWLFHFLRKPTVIRPALLYGREKDPRFAPILAQLDRSKDDEEESVIQAEFAKFEAMVNALPDGSDVSPVKSLVARAKANLTYKAVDELKSAIAAALPTSPELNVRMPTFGFNDEEAGALVRYFWVRDQLPGKEPYPYLSFPEREPAYVGERMPRMTEMRDKVVMADCIKCHFLDGKVPQQDTASSMAPDLAKVEERLRGRWLYPWMRNPAQIYPGTTMTQFWTEDRNTTPEQLQEQGDQRKAVVEFLLNYHRAHAAGGN